MIEVLVKASFTSVVDLRVFLSLNLGSEILNEKSRVALCRSPGITLNSPILCLSRSSKIPELHRVAVKNIGHEKTSSSMNELFSLLYYPLAINMEH